VVHRGTSAYNTPRSETATNEVLDAYPGLSAVLSFTAPSTRGVYSVLKNRSRQRTVTLVGCEQDSDLMAYINTGEIAAIAAENTYRMGYEAVGLISGVWAGKPLPARSVVPPFLLTKQNLNSAEARGFTSFPK